MMRSCFVLTVLLLTGGVVGQTPAVNSLTPWAVAPGQTTDVVLGGASLNAPTALWTNLPVEATITAGASDRATCRITLPAGAPVGIAALRVATRGGVSNLQLFMVDDLPTVAAGGDNHSPGAAREVAAPAAVEGACEPLRTDYYRIGGRRGRRVSVEVVAARLGSALDPVLRLLDASGRELAWADDSPGAGGDCRFEHVFADDGQYLVEVRDVNYDGGPGHRYRLRVGDFPLAVVPYPLGGKRGTAAMAALLGEGCEGAGPVLAGVARDARGAAVSARRAAGGGSGFATLVAGDLDETVEAEPNDSRGAATPLGFPVAVSGRMESAGDVDWYGLALRKGQRVAFRGRSRSLGSPCDLVMQLVREGGGRVAESKAEGPADAGLDATAPEDGTYWLRVAEIAGAGGPGLAYRIEVVPHRPGFSLGVETDKVDAKAGGTFELKVTCARQDYGGPVTLALEGLEPAALEGATIPAGKNEATLKVKLTEGAEAGSIVHFAVTGTAGTGEGAFRATASVMPGLRKVFPRMMHPPEVLEGRVALGVRGQ